MPDSILDGTKQSLGLESDYDVFDRDIIMFINAAFSTLNQLGLGPAQGFRINDASTEWVAYLEGDDRFNDVQTYVYLRVRLLFDPPQTGHANAAIQQQIDELTWRLNVRREDEEWKEPTRKSARS